MITTKVKTYRRRVGKNVYIIVKIFQNASATAASGNAIANNALNVQIFKQRKGGGKR